MDWQSVQPIFIWLSEHPAWSGLFVFLIAFTESLLIVGLIVPGTVLMFGVGTLVGTGVLGIQETLLVAFLGAVLGDGVSFWIGARYHRQLSNIWPLKNNPDYLNRGKRYFKKHGGKSIFFGRFFGPVRPVIPAVAGMMGMPKKYFFVINIISAAAWAPFYLLPGVVFGTSIGLASIVGTRLMVMLLALFVSTLLLIWLIRKMMAFVAPRIESFYLKCYRVAVVNSLFGSAVKAIIDPDTAERRGLYFFSILIILTSLILTLFVGQFSSSLLLLINETVENFVLLIRSSLGDQLMLLTSEFFSWLALFIMVCCFCGFLYLYKQMLALRHLALLLILAAISGFSLNVLSVNVLEVGVIFINMKILMFASFVSFVALYVGRQQNFIKRWLVFSVFSFIVLLLALVELYFGKVKATELVSSLSFAYLWVLLIITAFRRHSAPLAREKIPKIVIAMFGIFALTGSLWANVNYEKDFESLVLKKEKTFVTYQQWVDETAAQLSPQREDMFGLKKQALNLQWVGDSDVIKQGLIKLGWELPIEADYRTILYWLKPSVGLDELPRIPQTHLGEQEVVTMMKFDKGKNSAKVLQLWPSGFILKENNEPLWIGSISRQFISEKAKWLAYLQVKPMAKNEMKSFETNLVKTNFTVQQADVNNVLLINSEDFDEK